MNSRAKGQRGEREAAGVCRDHWHATDCVRNGQTNGSVCADLGRALPASSVEVKWRAKHAAFRFMEQAEEDAREGELPLLMLREDNHKDWLVAFDAARAQDFVARFIRQMHLNRSKEYTDKFINDARYGVE